MFPLAMLKLPPQLGDHQKKFHLSLQSAALIWAH
jgi:hypothetical protein